MSIRNDGLLTPFRVIDKELAWFLIEFICFFFLGGGGYFPGICLMKFPNAFNMYIKHDYLTPFNKKVITYINSKFNFFLHQCFFFVIKFLLIISDLVQFSFQIIGCSIAQRFLFEKSQINPTGRPPLISSLVG